MSHINEYHAPAEAALITNYFRGNESILSSIITFENIKWEATALNLAESILPEKLSFDLHFDMILSGGATAVTQYYKGLLSGKNSILEKAKASGHASHKAINESLASFEIALKSRLKNILNESDLAGFDAALSGGEYTPKSDGGTFGFLKSLGNALTEDGSPIGILHLVLDIIGVLGDAVMGFTGIPVGMIADILNAVIYFIRGKWLLGTISLIAGLIPFGGDVLKGFKGVAGPMEKVLVSTATKGNKAGVEVLSKVPAKDKGLVIKGLRFIARNIMGALGKAGKILESFFSSFLAKVTGWIPFIGKPLRSFFNKIGQTFGKYSDNMTNFSKGFGTVEKETLKLALKESDLLVSKTLAGKGKMALDPATNLVNCYDTSGKLLGQFSPELLTNTKVLNSKYPNLFKVSKDPQGKQILAYYNSVGRSSAKLSDGAAKYFMKKGWSAVKGTSRLAAFLGKQIIKLITGKEPQEAGYTDAEVEYWGNSSLNSWIADRIKKEKEETGAAYLPSIMLDSSDEEVFTRITNYQNNYADLLGMPHIIPVVYDKYGTGETKSDYPGFWKEIESEHSKSELAQKNESFHHVKSKGDMLHIKDFNAFLFESRCKIN